MSTAPPPTARAAPTPPDTPWQVFRVFLMLGLTSFGGPVAHLGHFRQALVVQRRWLDDRQYADLVALCQFLPGPASSQVGMALGLLRAGHRGALAAWAGFTLPSALGLMLLAWGLSTQAAAVSAGVLHGLKLAALAVVTQALWGMTRSLCPDTPRRLCMAATGVLAWAWPHPAVQVGLIALAGLLWARWGTAPASAAVAPLTVPLSRREGLAWLGLMLALLLGLPLAMATWPTLWLAVVDAFFRAGALVFGGGHVVLPLLQAEVVPNGWVSESAFMAGYGATQAVPGPLFTFAAYLGAALAPVASPVLSPLDGASLAWSGLAALGWGLLALVAVFAPAWMLLAGSLPFWEQWKSTSIAAKAILGINAAVVGLLGAAWADPVWPAAIHHPTDVVLAGGLLALLMGTRVPPWAVVALACALGWAGDWFSRV